MPPPRVETASDLPNNEKENEKDSSKDGQKDDDSSDDDDFSITIGELKKVAEVVTPGQQHQARFQPKVEK